MNNLTTEEARSLSQKIRDNSSRLATEVVTTGFDGFVDEMITVVGERHDLERFDPVSTIAAFGDIIKGSAGHSSLREIVVRRADPGGCAVNLGDGLTALGIQVDCYATLGQPVHPAFAAFARNCRQCHSWGAEPGRTLAFEFSDGKLMFSAMTQLGDFNPRSLARYLKDGSYRRSCRQSRIIALTDWSLYPHMTACWKHLQDTVYSTLPEPPRFYIDLVDPSSRSTQDIVAMLSVVPRFEESGRLTFGLNGGEANIISRTLGLDTTNGEEDAVRRQTAALRDKLGISEVAIHWKRFSVVATRDEVATAHGRFCENPIKTTGAGDRFNAGYCLGLLIDAAPRERLLLGCANAGLFVRQGRSPTCEELAAFIETPA